MKGRAADSNLEEFDIAFWERCWFLRLGSL